MKARTFSSTASSGNVIWPVSACLPTFPGKPALSDVCPASISGQMLNTKPEHEVSFEFLVWMKDE